MDRLQIPLLNVLICALFVVFFFSEHHHQQQLLPPAVGRNMYHVTPVQVLCMCIPVCMTIRPRTHITQRLRDRHSVLEQLKTKLNDTKYFDIKHFTQGSTYLLFPELSIRSHCLPQLILHSLPYLTTCYHVTIPQTLNHSPASLLLQSFQ